MRSSHSKGIFNGSRASGINCLGPLVYRAVNSTRPNVSLDGIFILSLHRALETRCCVICILFIISFFLSLALRLVVVNLLRACDDDYLVKSATGRQLADNSISFGIRIRIGQFCYSPRLTLAMCLFTNVTAFIWNLVSIVLIFLI